MKSVQKKKKSQRAKQGRPVFRTSIAAKKGSKRKGTWPTYTYEVEPGTKVQLDPRADVELSINEWGMRGEKYCWWLEYPGGTVNMTTPDCYARMSGAVRRAKQIAKRHGMRIVKIEYPDGKVVKCL